MTQRRDRKRFEFIGPDGKPFGHASEQTDWHHPEDYEYLRAMIAKPISKQNLTLRKLAWEFLRRNPEYVAAWRDWKRIHSQSLYDQNSHMRERLDATGATVDTIRHELAVFDAAPARQADTLCRTFGLILGRNPPSPEVFPLAPDFDIEEDTGPEPTMTVELSLVKPIGEQLDALRKLYQREREFFRDDIAAFPSARAKPRLQLYPEYIRLLDAANEGAQPAEIAEVLATEGRGHHGGKHAFQKMIFDQIEEARQMAAAGYRTLVARSRRKFPALINPAHERAD